MDNISLNVLDWVCVALYVVFVFAVALRVRLGLKTGRDYFLAGQNMHWIVVAISMYATLFSTISFVGVPGEAYENGVLLSIRLLATIIFTPLAVYIFLRFFYQAGQFTCYQYLEKRFDHRVRITGSLIFMITRLLYAGTVFYAAAKVFEAMVGWSPTFTILVVGAFAVLYTGLGGMRAVMITDAVQSLVLIGGVCVLLWKLSSMIGYDFAGMWSYASEQGRTFGRVLEPEFYSFDPMVRFTLWLWLLGGLMGPATQYGADQLVVQRLLSSKSYKEAKRAVWTKIAFTPIPVAMIWAVGLLLYYYYAQVQPLPAEIGPDQVLGYFIQDHLPAPVPGLIVAAMLAALMSTVDSTVNSLSTVSSVDILQRLGWVKTSEEGMLKLGRRLTWVWGGLVIALALLLVWAGKGIESTVLEVVSVWATLWGVLLMVMLAGVLTRYAKRRPALLALAVGMAVNLTLPWWLYYGTPEDERVSFLLIGVPGWIASGLIVFIGSLIDPEPAPDTTGLALRSVFSRRKHTRFEPRDSQTPTPEREAESTSA